MEHFDAQTAGVSHQYLNRLLNARHRDGQTFVLGGCEQTDRGIAYVQYVPRVRRDGLDGVPARPEYILPVEIASSPIADLLVVQLSVMFCTYQQFGAFWMRQGTLKPFVGVRLESPTLTIVVLGQRA